MAIPHGNRLYVQLLLDPHKGQLLKDEAEAADRKLAEHLRILLYKSLERSQPSSAFNEAQAKDEASWRESIARRVKGRQKARAERLAAQQEEILNKHKEAC